MIHVIQLQDETGKSWYRAHNGSHTADGPTMGTALDSLLDTIQPERPEDTASGMLIHVAPFRPEYRDEKIRRERLAFLRARWQESQSSGESLSASELEELETLIPAVKQDMLREFLPFSRDYRAFITATSEFTEQLEQDWKDVVFRDVMGKE